MVIRLVLALKCLLTYNKIMTTPTDDLMKDFGLLLTEVETLLQRAGTAAGAPADALQAEVNSKLLTAKQRLLELEGPAADAAKAVKRATEDYVHQNPWQSIGIAAALGFLAGILLTRR
jgi:ElaB/YqjD/DUF883 family membrane-anchored ribosome-binding protein